MTSRLGARALALAVSLALMAMALPYPALAVPPIPSSFYGTVTEQGTGSPVPSGTVIVALVGGMPVGQTATFSFQGNQVYSLEVRGDDPDTAPKDGALPGESLTFTIGGADAPQLATWQGGSNVRLDLTKPAVAPPPSFFPSGTATPAPTATPIPLPTVIPEAKVTPAPPVQGAVSAILQPLQQTRVELPDNTTIEVPSLTFPTTVQMQARSVPPDQIPAPPPGVVRRAIDIQMFDASGAPLGPAALQRPITITVPLTQQEVAAIGGDPNNVELLRYDEGSGTWVRLNIEVDLVQRVIRAQLRHLSLFAVTIPAPKAILPAGGATPGVPTGLLLAVAGLGVLLFGLRLLRGPAQGAMKWCRCYLIERRYTPTA